MAKVPTLLLLVLLVLLQRSAHGQTSENGGSEIDVEANGDDVLAGDDGIVRCNCRYDIQPDEEKNCTAYGLLSRGKDEVEGVGDRKGVIVPWHRANRFCLRDLNITVRNMTYDDMFIMCPNRDGSNASVTAVTNLWRDETFPYLARRTLNITDAGSKFFEIDDGRYKLKDEVESRTGEIVDCNKNLAFCWQVVANHLGTDAGVDDMSLICETVRDVEGNNSAAEQGIAREMLCKGAEEIKECGYLTEQILDRKGNRQNASTYVDLCSEIAVPAPDNRVPKECDKDAPPPLPQGESSSARSDRAGSMIVAATALASVFLIAVH